MSAPSAFTNSGRPERGSIDRKNRETRQAIPTLTPDNADFSLSETRMPNEHTGHVTKSEFAWKGTDALKRVHALNERCLEVLAQLAHAASGRVTVDIVNRHRTLWRGLDAAARRRAAQAPFLLLDAHFRSEDWWHWARNPRFAQRRSLASTSSFPPKSAESSCARR